MLKSKKQHIIRILKPKNVDLNNTTEIESHLRDNISKEILDKFIGTLKKFKVSSLILENNLRMVLLLLEKLKDNSDKEALMDCLEICHCISSSLPIVSEQATQEQTESQPSLNMVTITAEQNVEVGIFPCNQTDKQKIKNANYFYLPSFLCSVHVCAQSTFVMIRNMNSSSIINNNFPVDTVSYIEAMKFCNSLSLRKNFTPVYSFVENGPNSTITINFSANGYRLPTLAEWEFCAVKNHSVPIRHSLHRPDLFQTPQPSYNKPSEPNWPIKELGTEPTNYFNLIDVGENVDEWVVGIFPQGQVTIVGSCEKLIFIRGNRYVRRMHIQEYDSKWGGPWGGLHGGLKIDIRKGRINVGFRVVRTP